MKKRFPILVALIAILLGTTAVCIFLPKFRTNAAIPSLQWETSGKLLYEGGWPTNIMMDEDGFYYLAIFDSLSDTAKIRKMSDDGTSLWAEDVTVASPGVISKLVSDEDNGVIVVFVYDFDGVSDVYAQRIDKDGEKQWGTDGVVVSAASGDQAFVDAVSDGLGGVVVTWRDGRTSSTNNDIYAQRVNSSGTALWTANGVAVGVLVGSYKSAPHLVSDGSNGAIIAWSQNETGSRLIRGQRISSTGELLWNSDGVLVSEIVSYDAYPVSDGVGGVLIAGTDQESQIFVQHIDESGDLLWTSNGKIIASVTDAWFDISVAHLGAGNGNGGNFIAMEDGTYVLAWSDYRNGDGSYTDIYAQKIDSSGDTLWAENGVAICTEAQDQSNMAIVSDGDSGIISVWVDFRDDLDDAIGKLYAQRISTEGSLLWGIDGIVISDNELSLATYFSLVGNNNGGTIITWRQTSEESEFVAYGKKLVTLNQITGVQSNLDVLDEYGNSIKENSLSGANGTSVDVIVKDTETDLLISDVVVDLTTDRDWSIVAGNSSSVEKKSYIANVEDAPGATSIHTLYVPKGAEDTNVIICPNVTSLTLVNENCSGAITKSATDSDTSVVTIDGQSYWKVTGLTGTGGMSVAMGVSEEEDIPVDSTDDIVDQSNDLVETYTDTEESSNPDDSTSTNPLIDSSSPSTDDSSSNAEDTTEESSPKSNTYYVLYIVLGLALVGGIIFLVKKKKE